jgi:hypothetical protein
LLREGTERASDDLHVDAASDQQGNQLLQFAVADQWIATNERQVQWLEPVDNFENSVNQMLAFSIVQLAQGHAAAQVGFIVRVATRTSQRAFAREFYRKGRRLAPEDFPPGSNDFRSSHP